MIVTTNNNNNHKDDNNNYSNNNSNTSSSNKCKLGSSCNFLPEPSASKCQQGLRSVVTNVASI